MTLLVLDIGGTFVKYNIWDGSHLRKTRKFETPTTYQNLKVEINKIITKSKLKFDGLAISAPGNFNPDTREIGGISAVPYLHNFPIIDDLEEYLNLPVTIENDANCAGLCEMNIGIAKNYNNVACLVLGTGVGGSIFIDGELYRGSNNHSGEFGLTKNSSFNILSSIGSIVKVSNKFEEITSKHLNGEEIYELAKNGNQLSIDLIDEMYQELALFIYNLQAILDLELVVIGGGVSAQQGLAEAISKKVNMLFTEELVSEFAPEIRTSQYKNDANLIGAAIAFEKENK